MPFAKSPPELVARFDERAARAPEATRKLMFGFPSLVLGLPPKKPKAAAARVPKKR